MAGVASRSLGSGGGGAAGSRALIELPAELARSLDLSDGTEVLMQPLLTPDAPTVPPATSLQVEPVGESDWEVVELNAGHVEDIMLHQVDESEVAQSPTQQE